MALYDDLGGAASLDKVHQILYGKLFAHPWLRVFFEGKNRAYLISQQTDFMTAVFGGPKIYGGRLPKSAHMHMFIPEEVFTLRHDMLVEALDEARGPTDLAQQWLEYDMSMKNALVNPSPADCQGRYNNEKPLVVNKPGSGRAIGSAAAS